MNSGLAWVPSRLQLPELLIVPPLKKRTRLADVSAVLPCAFQVLNRLMSPTLTAPVVVNVPVPERVPELSVTGPVTFRLPVPVSVPEVFV